LSVSPGLLSVILLIDFPTQPFAVIYTAGFHSNRAYVGGIDMNKVNRAIERRAFETEEDEERYIAVARGFDSVEEMRTFFAARETRNSADAYQRRLTVLKLEVR
jgi:hypothetical protein